MSAVFFFLKEFCPRRDVQEIVVSLQKRAVPAEAVGHSA
jgi:hypothetical protein